MSVCLLQINECVPLPGHVFMQLYGCVRAFSRAGQKTKTCNELAVASDQNAYKSTVYEFDATSVIWADIKNVSYIYDSIEGFTE